MHEAKDGLDLKDNEIREEEPDQVAHLQTES